MESKLRKMIRADLKEILGYDDEDAVLRAEDNLLKMVKRWKAEDAKKGIAWK